MTDISYEHAVQLANAGRFAEAEAACIVLLAATPGDYLTLYVLGSIRLLTGDYEGSREVCAKLLEMRQNNADAFNMMAAISADHDQDNEATEEWLRRALACAPNHAKALTNLANLRLRKQDATEALVLYQRVMALTDGKDADALNGMAMIEASKGNLEKAIDIYKAALEYAPDNRQILTNLLATLYSASRQEEAVELALLVATYEYPGLAAVAAFSCAKSYCLWDTSDALLPVVLNELSQRINNHFIFMMPNLHLLGSYEVTNEQLLLIHRRSGQAIEAMRSTPPFREHPQAFTPGKKIRLAYISPDLKSHVVTHFFRELVNCRNRGRFELFLYSNLPLAEEDEVTRLYRNYADHFINVFEMKDTELAERIRADGIQILVEMSGYTTGNRLAALSYRPAPVQIGYLGYPFSYGLEEFDYQISDPWLDGPENAQYFMEQPLCMPQSFITIGEFFEQEINPVPPLLRNGYVTFGSLNNTYKLNRKTIELWSRILHRVPGSRAYLNHSNFKMQRTQDSIFTEFAKHGISKDRVTIITEKHPSGSHFRYYNDLDIMLDAMPLTGGTTTIDTLWMGVPVITKVGDTHPQRLSYSIINNIGVDLDDCIAFDEDEYVERAVALASKPERLSELRRTIPEAMKKGILCDPIRFTAQMESVLIEAWNRKFPETPIESLIEDAVYTPLPIGDAEIVVYDVLNDMHTYVLKEQGQWYEPEAAFLAKYAAHFPVFLDFSADPGMYAVQIARAQVDAKGRSLAIRTEGLSSMLLKKSIAHASLKNLIVATDISHDAVLPDLVRFSLDCNDGSGKFISQKLASLNAAQPLILASLRSMAGEDHSAMELLISQGYQPYRLLPGYELLVPLQAGEILEPSDINLFFCKEERGRKLAQAGLLVLAQEDITTMPTASDALWAAHMRDLPYASGRIDAWLESLPSGQWGDMYRLALNLDAGARDFGLSPPQRYARAKMAFSIITLLVQGEATACRLLTGIRIMADYGKRATAVDWAGALANGLEGLTGNLLSEPFLLPLVQWESAPIDQDEADWARTTAMVTGERLRSFSSWYTLDESLAFWQTLSGHSVFGDESQRMVELIQMRLETSSGGSSMGVQANV